MSANASEPTIVNREILIHALELTKKTLTNKTSDIAASRQIPIASALRAYGNDDGQLVIQRGPISVTLRNVFSTLPTVAVPDLEKQVRAFKKGDTIELAYEPEIATRSVKLVGDELEASLTAAGYTVPEDPGNRPEGDGPEVLEWEEKARAYTKARDLRVNGPNARELGGYMASAYKEADAKYQEATHIDEEYEIPRVVVRSGKRAFTVKGFDLADLPIYPTPESAECQALADRDDFLKGVDILKPIMSDDQTRPVLRAALMEFGEESTLMVATDSYRLGKHTLPALAEPDAFAGNGVIVDKGDLLVAQAIVKKAMAGEMIQICGITSGTVVRLPESGVEEAKAQGHEVFAVEHDEEVSNSATPTMNATHPFFYREKDYTGAMFKAATEHADVSFTVRLVDGNFPEWRRLWPQESMLTRSELNRDQLEDAIKAALVIAKNQTPPVPVLVEPDESTLDDNGMAGEVTISCDSVEGETFAENVEAGCDGWSPDSRFALNPIYFLDSVKMYDTDRLSFGVNHEGNSEGSEGGLNLKPIIIGSDALNMPMRDPSRA